LKTPGLDSTEELLAAASVSFRGATVVSSRSTFTLGSAHARLRAYEAWEEAARAAGFPTAGPDVILGLTARRLVSWRTSFGLGRPVELAGDVELSRIAQVSTPRLGIVTGLAIVLSNGAIVEFEALRGRRVRRFGAALAAAAGLA
jgi:hypothetical protein